MLQVELVLLLRVQCLVISVKFFDVFDGNCIPAALVSGIGLTCCLYIFLHFDREQRAFVGDADRDSVNQLI